MLRILSAMTCMVAALAAPSVANGQTCPAEVPETRVLVERFLTRPAHEPSRQETGLAGTAPSSIRRLQSGADDAACSSLNTAVGSAAGQSGPWRWTYYVAGDRFIVALQYISPPGSPRRVGFVPIYVYDASMHLLGTYAM